MEMDYRVRSTIVDVVRFLLERIGSSSLLIDEALDNFISDRGEVIERFLGVVHVSDTSAQSLKNGLGVKVMTGLLIFEHGLLLENFHKLMITENVRIEKQVKFGHVILVGVMTIKQFINSLAVRLSAKTSALSVALQQKNQNIDNIVVLITTVKDDPKKYRDDDSWDNFLVIDLIIQEMNHYKMQANTEVKAVGIPSVQSNY
ncbi:hypothetical protein M9H77_31225 [Catharanthus roseus]|uniref:Uncharacterized protein n=1 Tax=Catharanthus roseus TaxID=4058 RepID=A0ACC0A3R0_CATRO|nr:hypothetical protein M9H77_31225 [Catharanthus roseus]